MKRLHPRPGFVRRAVLLVALVAPGAAFADQAAAEAAVREGQALEAKADYAGAGDAYTRAIAEDPGLPAGWGRRGIIFYRLGRMDAAVADLGQSLALQPGNPEYLGWRIQSFLYMDRLTEASEEVELLIQAAPNSQDARSLKGRVMIRLGDVDGGMALQEKAWLAANKDPNLPVRTDGFLRMADWAGVRACAEEAIQGGAKSGVLRYHAVIAAVESGDYDGASRMIAAFGAGPSSTLEMLKLTLESTPAAGALYSPANAQSRVDTLLASTFTPEASICAARALLLTGRADRCIDLLAGRARRPNFECLFWLGAAYWKVGKIAEAQIALGEARRLNIYIDKHGARFSPEFASFLAALKPARGNDDIQDHGRLGFELATHLLTVAEIEQLVRRYRFAQAAAEYEKLKASVGSASRKAEIDARLPEVQAMAGALARLIKAIGSAKTAYKATIGKTELTIVKAGEEVFEFTIKGGAGKFPWACLEPGVFCDFAIEAGASPDDLFGLACLAWDAGVRERAIPLFEDAAKKKPALRERVNAAIARRRGMPVPPGGFVPFRGQYVTAEEKAQMEKGLVLWQGQWVTATEKENLSKGMKLVGGKWVPGSDADLLQRGCRKEGDRWLTPEEYEALHSKWENAWVEETAHYTIRTNESESFGKELGVLIESAWLAYRAWHNGAEPKLSSKEKMTLYAFRTYEDYRRHCVESKAEDFLAAAGFAKSDMLVAAGWNKSSNRQLFLQTMVHEGAHLYAFRATPTARPKSWYSEGLASYFEGYAWDGKAWKFGLVPDSRLPFARDAMKGGRQIPLADLVNGDAIKLINTDLNKALLFYAECWAIEYFLVNTENKTYKAAWAEYRKSVEAGRDEPLLKFFADPKALEADWIRFITSL